MGLNCLIHVLRVVSCGLLVSHEIHVRIVLLQLAWQGFVDLLSGLVVIFWLIVLHLFSLGVQLDALVHIQLQSLAGGVRQTEQIKFKFLVRLDHGLVAHRVLLAELLLHNWDNTFFLDNGEVLHYIIVKPLLLSQVTAVRAVGVSFFNFLV